MTVRDQTDMGGKAEGFLTTQWSLIEGIQKQQDPDRAMIGSLLERYWKPVYCYLRRTGCDNEQAKDLTQGFFHEVVLDRQLIQRADPAKGRFRAFLLHALKQYVVDVQRRCASESRTPAGRLVALEMADLPALPQAVSTAGPEECFLYVWKTTILDQTLAAVKEHCQASGLQAHWQLFRDHLLRPTLDGTEPPSLKELCRLYGIDSEKTASNMIITVKRRFQRELRELLRSTVNSEAEADEELRDILKTWHFGAQQRP